MTQLRRQTIDEITGVISTSNSTTSTLGISGVFTGTAEEITDYAAIFINIATDQNSITDGLSIQQSSDGTNWDHTDNYTIYSGVNKSININPHSRWFRIVYTNDGISQGYFRLQTIFKQVYSTPSSVRLNDTIVGDDDAQVTKSVVAIQGNDNDTFYNICLQNPLPVDGDTIYKKDLSLTNSTLGTFTGNIETLVSDHHSEIIDNTSTNPKTLSLHFERPIITNKVGISSLTGDFSNVKLFMKDVSGTVRQFIDDSGDNTKHTSNVYYFTNSVFVELIVEFHTADPVRINTINSPKIQSRTISSIDGLVSQRCSSKTPLLSGGVFTSGIEDTKDFGMIVCSVWADEPSAEDGLSIQFSSDRVNWHWTDEFTIPANKGKTMSIQAQARWMRIVYTNGGVDQTEFDLEVQLKPVYVKPSSHRVQDIISSQDDAELVKSVIAVEDSIGDIVNIGTQHPIPVTGDSIYSSEIDTVVSDNGGFSGSILDYFDSLTTLNNDATVTNPKTIKLWFKRTIWANTIGFGCNDLSKSFSNIKIQFLGSGEAVRSTLDLSADNTKRNSYVIEFEPAAFNGLIIEFHTSDEVGLSNITIPKESQVTSRIKAKQDGGNVVDIGATNNNNLRVSVQEYGDTPAIDAFARLRISEPFTIFDSKQLHDKQPLFWDEEIGGSATSTHSTVNASVDMTVTAASGDYVIRQTKQRFNYQPGKSQLIFFTFYGDMVSGVTKRMGLFDGTGVNQLTPNNGIFFEYNGSPSWNICKNGVTTETVPQSAWNVDTLDGTGVSGITLDLSATQIGIIDFEWLGVGRVRTGFVINGLPYYTHYFNHANDNSFTSVYMSTPNIPLRYSIESDGSAGGSVSHICSTIMSEGGIEKTGILRSIENANTFVTGYGTGNKYALVGLRLKSLYLDVTIIPEEVNIVIGTSDAFKWELQLNPTINGTFTYGDLTNSSVQYAQGVLANTLSADGIIVGRSGGSTSTRSSSSDLKTALRIGSTIAGVRDELVLVIQPFGANLSVWAGINFRELL